MNREAAPLLDDSSKKGTLVSHRWATANTAIPTFYKWPDQLNAVTKFLENDALGIDIFAIRRKSRGVSAQEFIAPVNRSNFKIAGGDRITAEVVITNKNIGHSFPPELRDFYEAYVEFIVSNDAGKALYWSGFIKPDGYLDEAAHNYKTYLVKADGTYNDKHHIWRTRVFAQNNQINSGRSDVARYQFQVPQNVTGTLRLTARVRYRRFTRVFSDYVLGKSVDYPIVTMASTEYVLRVGDNQPLPPNPNDKTAMPDWRRWNNYGIALFDQRQYPLAIDAFTHAAELDEKYRSMAQVNRALANIELEQYDEAAKIFADIKDDPGALSLANQFLRKHSEMSNESVYWHVHELSRTPGE